MFGGRLIKRKWGWYLTILDYTYFKVKLLRFHKYKKCSQQYHNYRNELWLFLTGGGMFNRQLITKGQYVSVAEQSLHQFEALENTLILELQYGEKCEEEDIVRVCDF